MLSPDDRARLRAQAAGDDVILRLVEGYAPLWLAALLGAAVMAAVMASDSQILALSTMFTEDIFAFYQGTARFGQAVQVLTGRIFVVLVTAVAYVIALRIPQSIFDVATQYAFAGYAALAPLLVAALFWKNSTRWGALATTLWTAAAVAAVAVIQTTVPAPPPGSEIVVWAMGDLAIVTRGAAGTFVLGLLPVVPMTLISGWPDDRGFSCDERLRQARRADPRAILYDEPPMTVPQSDSSTRLTPVQWLICAIAAIGFAFDIYEILMLPLIVRPALLELTGAAPGSPQFQMWVGRLFYIPAFAGGIFGLLGGYLTDRLGRRRVLTYSILIYAVAAFASGFSTSIEMLLVLRCFVFIGVCVEFVAAVAWLAELFSEPKRREKVLGYTQAFSSLGGILVATANGLCIAYASQLPCPCRLRPRHRRSACAVALHADVGRAAGDSADSDPAVPAGVAVVAEEESRRHARPAEHRRALLARAAPDDHRHDDHVRVRVRRRVRRHSADSADRPRACRKSGR